MLGNVEGYGPPPGGQTPALPQVFSRRRLQHSHRPDHIASVLLLSQTCERQRSDDDHGLNNPLGGPKLERASQQILERSGHL